MIRKVLYVLLFCSTTTYIHSAQHETVTDLSEQFKRLNINTPPPPHNTPRAVPTVTIAPPKEIRDMRKRTRIPSPEPTSPEQPESPITVAHHTEDKQSTRANSSLS